MPKLPENHKFLDLSDYGRIIAQYIALSLKNSIITPIHLTLSFIVAGAWAIYCILIGEYWLALFFLILKSVLDAADGELARVNNTPSYVGRYFDSVSDIILNFLILMAIWHISNVSLFVTILAFLGLQLQGTLYNYYYVILRNSLEGDTTSRIFEHETPKAMKGESQVAVNILFTFYRLLYSVFDRIIFLLDKSAIKSNSFPKWLMTTVSTFGLGFQLLLIGVMLILGMKEAIIPFFACYTLMIPVIILLRKGFSEV